MVTYIAVAMYQSKNCFSITVTEYEICIVRDHHRVMGEYHNDYKVVNIT